MGPLLTPGAMLGPYEIQAPIGGGGMGEVYRARDLRLDRTVAIKILRGDPGETATMRERFAREARAISQLNHPNICTLYDIGEQPSTDPGGQPLRYLVMEFVEGETLAARLERGPLPVGQALACAIQIAEALDRVHRAGIVHGDLKPGNIMLTRAGAKLLDFGLARLQRQPRPAGWADVSTRTVPIDRSSSILGTLQYLAPEQLEGRDSDERSDIFACGAVIYEMVTALKAFPGATHAAVMGAIMSQEPPPIATVQPSAPPALDYVVATCLAKDPDERWQDAGDLARQLKWVMTSSAKDAARPPQRPRLWMALAAGLLVTTAALAAVAYMRGRPAPVNVYRTSILRPEGLRFPGASELGGIERFAISPDGRQLAFVASDPNGNQMLWLRRLDAMGSRPLRGTDGASSPFWSPDSSRIGFVARGQLKIADPSGGAPVVVTSPALNTAGAWNDDDVILFTPNIGAPLHQVSAGGGTPRPVTTLDMARGEVLHRNPFFLPDGKRFLFVAVTQQKGGTTGPRGLYVGSLDGRQRPSELIESGSIAKYAEGHLLFVRDNALLAQPFDAGSERLTGEPRVIAEQLELIGPSSAAFTVSANGVLAYQAATGPGSQLVWMDRQGRQLGTLGDPARYDDLELSPDGRQAIVSVLDPSANTRDLWTFDIQRGVRTRFTLDAADDISPVWSGDSSRVAFASNRLGHFDIFQKSATGLGPVTAVLQDMTEKYPSSWLPGDEELLYWTFDSDGARLARVSPGGEDQPDPVLGPSVSQGRLSPDGKWLAYYSAETGRSEVYLVPYPAISRRWPVSSSGGTLPRWTADSRELLFASRDNRLMSVTIEQEDNELKVGTPQALFEARPVGRRSFFAPAPDGRILVNALQGESRSALITVVQNWSVAATP